MADERDARATLVSAVLSVAICLAGVSLYSSARSDAAFVRASRGALYGAALREGGSLASVGRYEAAEALLGGLNTVAPSPVIPISVAQPDETVESSLPSAEGWKARQVEMTWNATTARNALDALSALRAQEGWIVSSLSLRAVPGGKVAFSVALCSVRPDGARNAPPTP